MQPDLRLFVIIAWEKGSGGCNLKHFLFNESFLVMKGIKTLADKGLIHRFISSKKNVKNNSSNKHPLSRFSFRLLSKMSIVLFTKSYTHGMPVRSKLNGGKDHRPERITKALHHRQETCDGCRECEKSCSKAYFKREDRDYSAIRISNNFNTFHAVMCTQCGECINMHSTCDLSRQE